MPNLTKIKCIPCEGGIKPLTEKQLAPLEAQLTQKWERDGNKKLLRHFEFKNFVEAMEFINRLAALAEDEGHHPDICVFYNKVDLTLWTHAAGGVTQNDFILAAKIEKMI
jgi:4a-hydroxytetrahydrobiopterin dehydratase